MEEAKTDRTYCLKTCNKECRRKASNYVFKGGVERKTEERRDKDMKDFIEENFPFIILLIMVIVVIFGINCLFERRYEFIEKTLNYAIETNKIVEIK